MSPFLHPLSHLLILQYLSMLKMFLLSQFSDMQLTRRSLFSNQIDIAILVKIWLHVNIPDSSVVIPGYEIYRKDRSDGRSGGGILVC